MSEKDETVNAAMPEMPSPEEWRRMAEDMAKAAETSHKLVSEWLAKQKESEGTAALDPFGIGEAFLAFTADLMKDPARLAERQLRFYEDYLRLWQQSALRMMGAEAEPVIEPAPGDRRFRAPEWSENQVFDFLKQAYLLAARHINALVRDARGLDPADARKVAFYTRQIIDALSPSNYPLTNPEVLRETIESHGENLVRGLANLLRDLERGEGRLALSMTDETAFELGKNIATTPGKVVFENALFQLIQYAPTTETVHERPLLIYPPWINKFYILDLTPEKSFVRWCVDHGLTVFMVSWVNPDERYRDTSLDDYLREGQVKALQVVEEITGVRGVNVIGYCVAGTLLAATLAWLHARGEADRVHAATFLTTQVDFSDAGELRVFVDPEQLDTLAARMREKGYLDADAMFMTFNLLRANDLIWSVVVNNYLLGKDPPPFDLLYWNADSTNQPAKMHEQYLRKMYIENALTKPGAMRLAGEPIDLHRVRTPSYIQAGREDHIAPPQSVYRMTRILAGPKRFVLAGSGHIAGVINPPSANKYQYWTRTGRLPKSFDRFLEGAREHKGSWWPDWLKWLTRRSGRQVPARSPGSERYPPIEDAPGRYVKVRAR